MEKGDDPFGLLQIDGGNLLIGLELGMSRLQKRLELVDFQDFLRGIRLRIEVGNERKYAIRGLFGVTASASTAKERE